MTYVPDFSRVCGRRRVCIGRALALAAAAAALVAAAPTLAAQSLAPKAALVPEFSGEQCGPGPAVPVAASRPSTAVDSLLEAGSRAAILGDQYTAGELLAEAALLDPRNAVIAYRLGRTYEERGEAELAVGEYCRYLSMAADAPDAEEVRGRIDRLAASVAELDREELTAAVRAGLDAYQQRRYEAAVVAFTRVIEFRPGWASAYYNRALAELQLERFAAARSDLQAYLQLRPAAEDREVVAAFVEYLESGRWPALARLPTPGGVLLQGLVIPGLGQIATRRPVAGILVLGTAAAATAYGLREVSVTRTFTANDPFGNPYEFEAQVMERTNLVPALAVAGAVGLLAAVEAYVQARSDRSAARLSVPAPGGDRVATATLYTAAGDSYDDIALGVRLTFTR